MVILCLSEVSLNTHYVWTIFHSIIRWNMCNPFILGFREGNNINMDPKRMNLFEKNVTLELLVDWSAKSLLQCQLNNRIKIADLIL